MSNMVFLCLGFVFVVALMLSVMFVAPQPLAMRPGQRNWLSLFVLALSIFSYYHLGSWSAQRRYWKTQIDQPSAPVILRRKRSQAVIKGLESLLKNSPNRPKGWYLLGRIRFQQQRYRDASQAFRHAWQQSPHHFRYVLSYAQALVLSQESLPKPVRESLNRRLRRHFETAPLAVLAVDAYHRGQRQVAINDWKRLLSHYAPGSVDSRLLLQMIDRAEKSQGGAHG